MYILIKRKEAPEDYCAQLVLVGQFKTIGMYGCNVFKEKHIQCPFKVNCVKSFFW